jgi:hypothetical protein
MNPSRSFRLRQILAIAGGLILAAGVAAPLIHIPIVGMVSYLHQPESFHGAGCGGAIVILAGAALAIGASLAKSPRLLWIAGLLPLAQLGATIVGINHMIAAAVARADAADVVDPVVMWTGAILRQAHYEWGIAVIALGAAMVLAAAALRD